MFLGSKPLAAISSKPLVQGFFVVIGVFLAFSVYPSYKGLVARSYRRPLAFCMHMLQARDSSIPPSSVGVSAFGLLKDGCPIPEISTMVFPAYERACLSLETVIETNGYFFDTISVDHEESWHDPVRWSIVATDLPNALDVVSAPFQADRNGTFIIGASSWSILSDASIQVHVETLGIELVFNTRIYYSSLYFIHDLSLT